MKLKPTILACALAWAFAAHGAAGDYVDRSGTIATGGTSQTLASADAGRGNITIYNLSTESEILCVNVTSAASCSTAGSWHISPGGSLTLTTKEAINIVAATTGHKFTAKERVTDGFAGPQPAGGAAAGGGAATIADGADVTQGAMADAAALNGAVGSLSAKLRALTSVLHVADPVTGTSNSVADLSSFPFAVGKGAAQVIVHVTANTATLNFSFSADGTAAYQPTYCHLISNGGSSGIGVASTTTTGVYMCPVRGTHFKLAQTNAGAITAVAAPVAGSTITAVGVNAGGGTFQVNGAVAEDSPVTGQPGVPQGFEARNSNKTAVSASGDSVRGVAKLTGEQIVYPWSIPDATWQYASTADVTDTTSTEMVAAGGAGIRRYVNSCRFSNTDATVGTYVNILSAATVIDVVYVAPQIASTAGQNSVPVVYAVPKRGGVNEAINFQAVTTSAQLRVSCEGITSAQ